jgi:hypothetical protein
MSAVRSGLYSKLVNTGAITALVGQRVYHSQAPEGAPFPYVIFSKSSGVKTRAFQKPEAYKWETWLVKGVDRGTSSNLADEIASAIDATLDGGTLTVSGKTVADLHHVGDVEYVENSGDQQYRHAGASYRVVLV